jgi:hypothetical protein
LIIQRVQISIQLSLFDARWCKSLICLKLRDGKRVERAKEVRRAKKVGRAKKLGS